MSIAEQIKNQITEERFVEVIKKYNPNIKKTGNIYRCSCPIHGGDNETAFNFNPENMLFNCYTECGGGDCFDFIAMIHNIDMETDFGAVLKLTASEFGVSVDSLVELDEPGFNYKAEFDKYLKYVNGKSIQVNMPYDLKLLGNRYPIKNYRGIDKELLDRMNVSYIRSMNRICFAIKNEKGVVVGASLRATGDETPKWLHRPRNIKTRNLLYNLDNVVKTGVRCVFLVEGLMDCINLVSQGINNVVATFGANLTLEQTLLLVTYFDEVILMYDNDKAGKIATVKAIEKLKKLFSVKVCIYEGKDPGELNFKNNMLSIIDWYEYEE